MYPDKPIITTIKQNSGTSTEQLQQVDQIQLQLCPLDHSTKTQVTNSVTIESDYNSIKSSMVKFDEETNLKKFNTYSQVVIKKYINDKITTDQINSMLTQLCALAEYVWKNEFQAGELKKYNVKLQLRNALITDTSTTQIIAECFIDTKIDQIIDSNSTKDLLQLAQNILKITVKLTSGCLKTCV
ncbi:Conserved_hypothetical protein [Hexamita inflata]|uniref:Uncharacterized protein n=1 Tax=Hexamita inflata TaxID=28002 RepID=A0AA86RFN6_9EUKA|nr:Conserved hypothetical protein [Hexamita inflata]